MNTSEQLKNESIDRIWIAKIGEHNYLPDRKYALENDGFILLRRFHETMIGEQIYSNDYEQKAFAIEFRKPDVMHIRPIELSGIENNNGWTRIEPDGSNLPESGEYWVVDTLNGIRSYLYHVKDGGDIIFWKNQVTHFQLINKPKPPIF